MKASSYRLFALSLLVAVLCLSAGPTADSKELYVVYHTTSDQFHFGKLDYSNPEVVQHISAWGHHFFTGLEFAGNGKLYTFRSQLWSSGQLFEVNPVDGTKTPIGPSNSYRLDDLAYNPVDGKMYGVYPAGRKLYTVDLDTGGVTLVGTMQDNGSVSGSWMAALAIDKEGYFYVYNNSANYPASEQGIWRSTVPGGLQFEMVYDFWTEFGLTSTSLQIPALLFLDWSTDDEVCYGFSREHNGSGWTTGWFSYDFDDQGLSWTQHPIYPLENTMLRAWTAPPTITPLTADAETLSVSTGGRVDLDLNAGSGNASRNYLVLGSLSGSVPGIPLPSGGETLPTNWDGLTDLVLAKLNTPMFNNFLGALDMEGMATAQINVGPVNVNKIGKVMTYAYCLEGTPDWDFVSNPVEIEFVP